MSTLEAYLAAKRQAEAAREQLQSLERSLPPSEQPDDLWRRVYAAAYRENRKQIRAGEALRRAADRAEWRAAHPEAQQLTVGMITRKALQLFHQRTARPVAPGSAVGTQIRVLTPMYGIAGLPGDDGGA